MPKRKLKPETMCSLVITETPKERYPFDYRFDMDSSVQIKNQEEYERFIGTSVGYYMPEMYDILTRIMKIAEECRYEKAYVKPSH